MVCDNIISNKIEKYRQYIGSEIINPVELAEYEKVRITQANFDNYQSPNLLGYYAIDKENKDLICFRAGIKVDQMRKVIAHELCHIFLFRDNKPGFHVNTVIDIYDNCMAHYKDNQKLIENKCEEGAREILMPKNTFMNAYAHWSFRLDSIEELIKKLSNIFSVETCEVRQRIIDLELGLNQ